MLLILPGRRKKINQTPDHQSVILEWAALKTLPSSGLTKSTQSSYATPQTIWHASTDPNKQKYLKRINSPISPLHARTLAPPLYTAVRSHIQQLGTSPLGWKMRRIKWQHCDSMAWHSTPWWPHYALHVPQNSPLKRTPKNQGAMHILCSIQGLLELSECWWMDPAYGRIECCIPVESCTCFQVPS